MRTRLDFCSSNFHIFRFSRSGKGEADVHRFMSKHSSTSSDQYVLFCHDHSSHLAINVADGPSSSCLAIHCQFDIYQFDRLKLSANSNKNSAVEFTA